MKAKSDKPPDFSSMNYDMSSNVQMIETANNWRTELIEGLDSMRGTGPEYDMFIWYLKNKVFSEMDSNAKEKDVIAYLKKLKGNQLFKAFMKFKSETTNVDTEMTFENTHRDFKFYEVSQFQKVLDNSLTITMYLKFT